MASEIVSFCSGVLASVLANVLGNAEDGVKNSRKKKKIEQKILEDLDVKIKDEFEQECVKEWIFKQEYQIKQEGYIFGQEDKQEFISNFFSQNRNLNYIHSQSTENVISRCIDEVNEWANGVLSDESRIVIGSIKRENRANKKEIINQIIDGNKVLLEKIDEIKDSRKISIEKNIDDDLKECIGYGIAKGKCKNLVTIKENIYCNTCLNAEYYDKIQNLYKVQNYLIKSKKKFFVAEQRSGIIRSRALILPVYSETYELSTNDIETMLEIINYEDGIETYQYIHIVTNSVIKKIHESFFSNYKGRIKIFNENDIINEIMDFTGYLENNIVQYRESNLYDHYIDVLDFNTGEPLEYSMRDFLQEIQYNAFLILGDYGCGKTSFLLNLAYKLSVEYLSKESEYIPIFIPLKDYVKAINMENLFLDIFVNKCHMPNVSIEAFKLMLKYMKFVLLFDGFDEVAKRVNYDVKFEVFNQICQYCNENTKIIVTCRPNYFQENREYKKLIENAHLQFEPNAVNKALFKETYIADLNSEQINQYILSYQDVFLKNGLDVREIEYLISNTHDLTDLSRRPFLLNIIVQTLPQIFLDLDSREKKDLKINAASLYRNYTDLWLDRENSKGKTLIRKEDKLHFCMHISYKMFKEDILSIHFSEMPTEIKEYFPNLYQMDEIDYFSHDIQSCSFMNSDGEGNFKFIHKSFMEYFVACYILEILQKYKEREPYSTDSILSIRNISTEIALFINDMLSDNDELYQRTKKVLEVQALSADDSIKQNAVALLSKMEYNMANDIKDGVSYLDNDFSYSNIENRIITGVNFSRVTFYGTLIQDVKFIDCHFEEANFQKAKLINVDFSNQSLEYSDLSYCVIRDCTFISSCLAETRISQSVLENNNFQECDMSGVEAIGTKYNNNYNYESAVGIPYELH